MNSLLQKFSEHLSPYTVALSPLDSNQLNLARTLQSTQIPTAKINAETGNTYKRSVNCEVVYKLSLASISKLLLKASERKPLCNTGG